MSRPAPSLRTASPLLVALIALGGCGRSADDKPARTETAAISFSAPDTANGARSVSVTVPGFAARLDVPGLAIGAGMSIDGIPFRPETVLGAVAITGAAGDGSGGEGHGTVEMRFTDAGSPDQVLGYYRQAARRGGWTEVPPAAGQQFAATRHETDGTEHLAIQVGAAAAGSSGRFVVTGG